MECWKHYWFAPTSCFDLAMVRVIVCAGQLIIVAFAHPQHGALLQLAELPDELYRPFNVLKILNLFLGWGVRPDPGLVEAIYFITIAAGLLSLIGLATNASLAAFAVGSVYIQAYIYAFGDWHHPEAAMMVALSVLALSPCGRVLSVDAWWRRRRGRDDGVSWLDVQSAFAGWPLKLMQWFFALMYLSAVFNKLAASGLDWANGYTLQYHLAEDSYRHDSPFALWLSQFHYLVMLAQVGVLTFQATFSLAVIFPMLRWIYVPAGLLLHSMIYLTLKAFFFQWITLYCVFIPWSKAARMLLSSDGLRSLQSRTAS